MISGLEFGVCMGVIVLAGVACAWVTYHLGWIHGYEEERDQIRRERGELPYGYPETKKKGDRG